MRLLLIEDDETLGEALSGFLRLDGHLVDWFKRLIDAQTLVGEPYDALLVDWQLPDGSGLDWVRRLRERGETVPIIMITARDQLTDRIKGLDNGADDYLVKPFQPEELAARLRALRRRAVTQGAPRVSLGASVELDLGARQAFRHGVQVELTAREWNLLGALVARAGRLVSKPDLEALSTGFDSESSSNTLEVHVFNLRRKLGRECIETVRGMGYRVPR